MEGGGWVKERGWIRESLSSNGLIVLKVMCTFRILKKDKETQCKNGM